MLASSLLIFSAFGYMVSGQPTGLPSSEFQIHSRGLVSLYPTRPVSSRRSSVATKAYRSWNEGDRIPDSVDVSDLWSDFRPFGKRRSNSRPIPLQQDQSGIYQPKTWTDISLDEDDFMPLRSQKSAALHGKRLIDILMGDDLEAITQWLAHEPHVLRKALLSCLEKDDLGTLLTLLTRYSPDGTFWPFVLDQMMMMDPKSCPRIYSYISNQL